MSSVRVNLSNGKSSSVFENSDFAHFHDETINFNPNTPIRAVASVDGGSWVLNFEFMDSTGKIIYFYDPNEEEH